MISAAAGNVLIDCSYLASGGQAVRTAVALSALMSKPVSLRNVRQRKANSGLSKEIIADVELVRDICNGRTAGCHVGSPGLDFTPGPIRTPGKFLSAPNTATSISKQIQAALPCLTFLTTKTAENARSKLFLVGQTNARFSPQIEYMEHILFPFLRRRFGLDHHVDIVRRGHSEPRGVVNAEIDHKPTLPAFDLLQRGAIKTIKGRAYASGHDIQLADRIRAAATTSLIMADINPEIIDIAAVREHHPPGTKVEKASGLVMWAETENGCVIGGSSIGLEPPNPRAVAHKASTELLANLRHGGCVDEHLQDQMIIWLALAKGRSRVRTGPLTEHTKSAMWTAEQLTGARFNVTADSLSSESLTITCDGIAYIPPFIHP
ncbi:RNA 3'-terminal phosphate cyclase [Trametopsis cervina]|nr:RNA 3'-terminal phosphate cyclase [Trametopsis cervina]